jgi:predicted RNase H-like nuclease (RuvC/YqgF family)
VSLRNENANLITKIDKLKESISSLKTENDKLISKAKDLNICNVFISNLRNENAILHAKIDELKSCNPLHLLLNMLLFILDVETLMLMLFIITLL